MPASGKICLVSNCTTQVYKHGNICAKHRWRKRKFNSYDLPNYTGVANLPIFPELPEGFIKNCKVHGYLFANECYSRSWKGKPNFACKRCASNRNRRRNFGFESEDDYLLMLENQDFKCAICKIVSKKLSSNGVTLKSLCVDHNHKTGKIRELLCDHCNQGIGHFRDSIPIMESAIIYLKKHK